MYMSSKQRWQRGPFCFDSKYFHHYDDSKISYGQMKTDFRNEGFQMHVDSSHGNVRHIIPVRATSAVRIRATSLKAMGCGAFDTGEASERLKGQSQQYASIIFWFWFSVRLHLKFQFMVINNNVVVRYGHNLIMTGKEVKSGLVRWYRLSSSGRGKVNMWYSFC